MSVETELARLEEMTVTELRERWAGMVGTPAPKVSTGMLRLALAWEIQASADGGVPRATTRLLDQLERGLTKTAAPRAGMRLVREWGGKVHVVTIGDGDDDHGVIRWDNREWHSLSQVARAITGTRWSGSAFFGLKRKVAA